MEEIVIIDGEPAIKITTTQEEIELLSFLKSELKKYIDEQVYFQGLADDRKDRIKVIEEKIKKIESLIIKEESDGSVSYNLK